MRKKPKVRVEILATIITDGRKLWVNDIGKCLLRISGLDKIKARAHQAVIRWWSDGMLDVAIHKRTIPYLEPPVESSTNTKDKMGGQKKKR